MSESPVIVRLRLLGAQAFSAAARAAAGSLDEVGAAGRRADTGLRESGRGANRATAALARLKGAGVGAAEGLSAVQGGVIAAGGLALRGARMLTMAGGTAAVAIGAVGSSYNKMQDEQRVAFTTFLGSGRRAQRFMRQLQTLAQKSPVLDPKSTGDAARSLLAYGINAKKTLPLVKAIGDMSAASGRSVGEVMPMAAKAIGQIASKGKLQTEELNQLAESVGLNRNKIAKQLHMSKGEFASTFTPGNNISAAKAIPAIQAAMQEQSGGAAKRLAKTTGGQLDRLKETLSKRIGGFTRPLYDAVGRIGGRLATSLQKINLRSAGKTTLRVIQTVIGVVGRAIPRVIEGARTVMRAVPGIAQKVIQPVKAVIDALKPAAPFLSNVILPLLKGIAIGVIGGVVMAFKLAVPIVKVVATALGWLGQRLRPLRGVFQGIGVALGIVFGPAILGRVAQVAARAGRIIGGGLGTAMRVLSVALRIAKIPLTIIGFQFKVLTRGVGLLWRGFVRLQGGIGRFAGTFGGVIRKVLVGATNLAGGVINKVEAIAGKIRGLGGKFLGAGRGLIRSLVRGLRTGISGAASFIGNIAGGLMHFINTHTPFGDKIHIPGPIPDIHLPSLPEFARGGVVRSPLQVVGERGPEIAALPQGSRVMSHSDSRRMVRAGASMAPSGGDIVIRFQPTLDGRPIHQSVHRVERRLLETS